MAGKKISAEQRQALKELRERMGEDLARRVEENKEAIRRKKAIREFLSGRPATVPEIAAAVGLPKDRALWLVTAMKKYGEVREEDQDGDYIRYALTEETESAGQGPEEEEEAS